MWVVVVVRGRGRVLKWLIMRGDKGGCEVFGVGMGVFRCWGFVMEDGIIVLR